MIKNHLPRIRKKGLLITVSILGLGAEARQDFGGHSESSFGKTSISLGPSRGVLGSNPAGPESSEEAGVASVGWLA